MKPEEEPERDRRKALIVLKTPIFVTLAQQVLTEKKIDHATLELNPEPYKRWQVAQDFAEIVTSRLVGLIVFEYEALEKFRRIRYQNLVRSSGIPFIACCIHEKNMDCTFSHAYDSLLITPEVRNDRIKLHTLFTEKIVMPPLKIAED